MSYQSSTYPKNIFFKEKMDALFNRSTTHCLPLLYLFLFFILGKLLYVISYYFLLHGQMIENNLISNLCRWDCGWYRSVIADGYNTADFSAVSGQANWAFFPLFPLISRGLIWVFDSEFIVLIFNQILFFASMILLYQYCANNYSKNVALIAALSFRD